MSGLLLEALLALVILVLIVWWTMFSGRPRGEVPQAQAEKQDPVGTRKAPDAPSPPAPKDATD